MCIFAFDLLYLNGESLVGKPFRERRRLLHESIRCVPGELVFAESRTTSNVDEINMYLEQSVKDGCEGLMVKTLDDDATYEIAKRSHKWLKVCHLNRGERGWRNLVFVVEKRLSRWCWRYVGSCGDWWLYRHR